MTARPRILIACIGNIFLGDDAFGVEVAMRLAGRPMPDGVRVVDYGIRGLDLAYALLDGDQEVTIFVDATARGGEPGTIYVIEPDLAELGGEEAEPAVVEAHGMDPLKVLRLVRSMGGTFSRILLVGCEPATLGPENEGAMGLSEPVAHAVGEAVGVVESLVATILEERRTGAVG
jgi:hydrogenase maturation protease